MADDTGRISIDLFCSLDLVAQAPGGPDEDPSGGFALGGWQAAFGDAVDGAAIMAGIERMDALLLGRRTYEIFAGYWPRHADTAIGRRFARIPKYVASRAPFAPAWSGSSRIGADLAAEVAALRDRHREVHVIGSTDLVQTLVGERLFDELTLYVYPLLLGAGKRVFRDASPANLRLLADAVTTPTGTLILRYGPGDGVPVPGRVGPE